MSGPGLAVPPHLAAQQQHEAIINGLRLQIASGVMAHLMSVQYVQALQSAQQQADPLGLKEPGEPTKFSFLVNLDGPANLSVAAADALLSRLRLG